MAPKEKCDSCGQMFTNREVLVTYIVDLHTDIGVQQARQVEGGWHHVVHGQEEQQQQDNTQWIQCINSRNLCHRCNIEVDYSNTVEKHICRMPLYDLKNKCHFLKLSYLVWKESKTMCVNIAVIRSSKKKNK